MSISSMYAKLLTINNGPSIHAIFYICKEGIEKIELEVGKNDGFSWSIIGNSFPPLEAAIAEWIRAYISRSSVSISLPLLFSNMPPYTLSVLTFLKQIGYGKSVTYQDLAILTGSPLAARAVGNACGRNPFPLVIPCHRVLAQGNKLGGFSCGLEIKRRLLRFENIPY